MSDDDALTLIAISGSLGLDIDRLQVRAGDRYEFMGGYVVIEGRPDSEKPWRGSILGRQWHEATTLEALRDSLERDILPIVQDLAELGRMLESARMRDQRRLALRAEHGDLLPRGNLDEVSRKTAVSRISEEIVRRACSS